MKITVMEAVPGDDIHICTLHSDHVPPEGAMINYGVGVYKVLESVYTIKLEKDKTPTMSAVLFTRMVK